MFLAIARIKSKGLFGRPLLPIKSTTDPDGIVLRWESESRIPKAGLWGLSFRKSYFIQTIVLCLRNFYAFSPLEHNGKSWLVWSDACVGKTTQFEFEFEILSGYTLYRLPARQICSTCILAIGGKRERQLCEEATCRFFECQAGEQVVPLIQNFRFFIQHSWKVVSYRIEQFLEVCLRVENLYFLPEAFSNEAAQ